MRTCTFLLPGLLLLLGFSLACGGGKTTRDASTPAAKGLVYTDPAGTGWRLVKDSSSSATQIVLNLVGPSGVMSRGVGFNLAASTGVHFGTFADTGLPIKDAGVYELLSQYSTYALEPKLLVGGVKPGNLLTAAIFQKDRRFSAKDSGTTLCQISLELDTAASLHAGDTLTLSIPKAKIVAGDIGVPGVGGFANDADYFDAQSKAHLVPIAIAVGTLVAQ